MTDKSLVREDNFDLTCEVTSNPPVSIEWFADGQKLVKQNSEFKYEPLFTHSLSSVIGPKNMVTYHFHK